MNNFIFLYHITKEKHIASILIDGLKINSHKVGFVKKSHIANYYKKYGMQPIFLTNDIDYIIKTQLTDVFIKDCVILKIDISSLIIENEYNYLNNKWNLYYNTKEDMLKSTSKYFGRSFICKTNIKPELIYEEKRLD
jgi:hypothetical protein